MTDDWSDEKNQAYTDELKKRRVKEEKRNEEKKNKRRKKLKKGMNKEKN